MLVIEYRIEDVENSYVVVLEYPDTRLKIQHIRIDISPKFPDVVVRYFLKYNITLLYDNKFCGGCINRCVQEMQGRIQI